MDLRTHLLVAGNSSTYPGDWAKDAELDFLTASFEQFPDEFTDTSLGGRKFIYIPRDWAKDAELDFLTASFEQYPDEFTDTSLGGRKFIYIPGDWAKDAELE